MNPPSTVLLTLGVVLVLLLATTAGALAKWRLAQGRPHRLIDLVNSRVAAWWVTAALLLVAFALGRTGVVLLFALVSFYALREFISLSYTRRGDHLAIAAAFYIGLPAQYYLVHVNWYGLYTVFIPVYAFLVLPILSSLSGDSTRFLERTAKVQWGLMLCVFCISHVPALLTLPIPNFDGRQPLLIAFLLIVVQGGDLLQELWPALLRRTRLGANARQRIAPVLALACTALLGALLAWLTPLSMPGAAAMALVMGLMGYFGRRVMTAIKRDRGVSQWGALVDGYGGMLDRLDSVIFAAPIFFHLLRYVSVP